MFWTAKVVQFALSWFRIIHAVAGTLFYIWLFFRAIHNLRTKIHGRSDFEWLTLLVDIRNVEKGPDRKHNDNDDEKNAINLEIRLPDSVLRSLSSNFTLNSINWTKFIRIILHCILPPIPKERILIALVLSPSQTRKNSWTRIQQQQKMKCPLWDYKRRILKFACLYIYLLNASTVHTLLLTH